MHVRIVIFPDVIRYEYERSKMFNIHSLSHREIPSLEWIKDMITK